MKTTISIALFALSLLTARAQYFKLLDFPGATNGGSPRGSLVSDGTFLYGVTQYGGANNMGVIFKVKNDVTGYVKLLDFDGTSNGNYPAGSLIYDGTYLYGVTQSGGGHNLGTVFKIKYDGTGYSKLLDFASSITGKQPAGALFSDGSFLYGMTAKGGTNDDGTIFKIRPDGTGFVKLLDFAGFSNGSSPFSAFISDGIFLYATTYFGGTNDGGTIFKIKPDGTGYAKLLDFDGANGSDPRASLVSDGTFLYGMTQFGGTFGFGTIFKIRPDGFGYTKLVDFFTTGTSIDATDALILDGAFLYGTTQSGGSSDYGTMFRIKPDGTGYSRLVDFDGSAKGKWPTGSLVSDGGFLCGMTSDGGTSDLGVLFKYLPIAPPDTTDTTTIGIHLVSSKPVTDFDVYPNLSDGNFFIKKTDGKPAHGTVKIYNQMGAKVDEISISEETSIVRVNVPNGSYFIQMITDTGTTSKRIIIAR